MTLASQLTQRVRIEQPVATNDEYGGQTIVWTEVATVFADVQPIFRVAAERLIAGQRDANAGYRVTMRLRSDLTAVMRLVWKTHVLLIHSLHEAQETLSILTYEEHV